MNAVNLLTLMFAAPEATNSQTSANTQQVQPGMEFSLLLQQQIWMNSCPQCLHEGTSEESAIPFDLLLENSLTVLPDGSVLASDTGVETPVGDAAGASDVKGTLIGGTPLTEFPAVPPPVQMLGALVDELRQILAMTDDAVSAAKSSNAGDAKSESSEPSPWNIAGRMMAAWNRTIQQFNNWLASSSDGGYKAHATTLIQQPAAQPVLVMPWSTIPVSSEKNLLSGSSNIPQPALIPAPQPMDLIQVAQGLITLEDGSGDDTPESIRWFQTVGIVGRNSETVNALVKPQAMATAELPLGEDGFAKLTMVTDPRPIPGAVQAYSLRIELPGNEGSMTASLVVQRMDSGLQNTVPEASFGQTPMAIAQTGDVLVSQPVSTEPVPDVTNNQPAPLLTGVRNQPVVVRHDAPAQVTVSEPAPEITVTVPTHQAEQMAIPVVKSGLTPAIVTMGSHQTVAEPVAEMTVAERLQAPDAGAVVVNPIKQHRGAPDAPLAVKTPVVKADLPPVTRSVAIPVVEAQAELANVPERSEQVQNWSVDHTLENLGLRPQTLETLASRPELSQFGLDRSETAAMTTATQLAGAFNQPQAVVNTGSMPMHLMQFAQVQPEIQPYTGLEYLDMAERVMEHVNTLRSGGGGFYQARLNLNPPHLGEMFVNISVRGDAVALQMCVVSATPREQLKDSLDALRQSLEEAGLYVTELRVEQIDSERDESGEGSRQRNQDSGSQSQSRTTSPLAAAATAAAIGSSRMVPAIGFGT